MKNNKGFTLIELLVVIAIIGVLSSVVLVSINNSRSKARDAQRLSDVRQIRNALELYYYANNNTYPNNTDNDCSGWDIGFNGSVSTDTFIQPLKTQGFIDTPGDPASVTGCTSGAYYYYRYGAGNYGCDPARGAYYVLGIGRMESKSGTWPTSPGWSCPSRNWQNEFAWVTGSFER